MSRSRGHKAAHRSGKTHSETERCIVMIVRALAFALFVCSTSSQRSVKPAECEVRLRTSAGWVCGKVRVAEDVYKYVSFRGVPYGKPPLAERRFSELEPLDPWDYLLDATEDGPVCPQKDIIYWRLAQQPRGQSEDCIHLNLHVPYAAFPGGLSSNAPEQKGLPILVMIHGGGFHTGSGLTDMHGPEYLITKEVIVISFNYRLNVFGFLSLGTGQVPGNQALRDMLAALRWVQQHAAAFGGDPGDVTLMGQSAGASAVHLLSLSKAAEGLFHRIFLMSGHGIPNYFATSPKFAKEIATDYIKLLGINSTDPSYIHERLTKMPLVDIMQANSIIQYHYGLTSFGPVEEGLYPGVERVLDANPLQLIAEGRGSQYPMLIGYVENEMAFFKWVVYNYDMTQRIERVPNMVLPRRIGYAFPDDSKRLINTAAEKCFRGNYNMDNFEKCYSYMFFIYPALKIAEWRGLGGAPTYLYKYTYESERSLLKEGLWTSYEGATHVEDLTYIFRTNSLLGDHVSFPPNNDDDRMKLWWVTIVTNFMKCNNPTCNQEAEWPPVSSSRLQYQQIARPMVYQMEDLNQEEADWVRFYDELDVEIRNVTEELKKYWQSESKNIPKSSPTT